MDIKYAKRLLVGFYGHRCFYCDRDIKDLQITIDHKWPKSKGGQNDLSNLCLACQSCNSRKGGMSLNEFRMMRSCRTRFPGEYVKGFQEFYRLIYWLRRRSDQNKRPLR